MVKQNAAAAARLARQLNSDDRLRENLLCAYGHAVQASRLARRRFGRFAPLREIVEDQELRMALEQMLQELQDARKRFDRKRSHRFRNGMLLVAGAGAATAFVLSRSPRVNYQQNSPGEPQAERQPQEEQAEQAERAA